MSTPFSMYMYFDVLIYMVLAEHQQIGGEVGVMYMCIFKKRSLTQHMLFTNLEYTDDLALLTNSWEDLKRMLMLLEMYCSDPDTTINVKKQSE